MELFDSSGLSAKNFASPTGSAKQLFTSGVAGTGRWKKKWILYRCRLQHHRTSRVSNIVDDYKERVSYDGNGNILTYLRNGHEEGGLEMDNLTYEYYAGTNRLRHVKDQVSDNIFSEDIDDQPDGNYEYDEIGKSHKR